MNDKITFQVETFGAMNLAMQQNYVPLVRSVIIKNNSDEELHDIKVKISFEPDFAKPYLHNIEVLPANAEVEVSPVNIIVSTEYLFSLTERLVAQLCVEIMCGEEVISNGTANIDLLAYDQWTGYLIMPEMIAAFVTPNHPDITGVLSKATEYMTKWGKQPRITGYITHNPDEVKVQMAAVYAALQSCNINYNLAPATFEKLGQRVRLPYSVIENKQGTCIDLTVTYASCLEAAGLNPLIMLKNGHAYCGCRLEEETFADCVIDDFSAIDKRTVSGSEDILLVECTDFTAGKNVDFERALKHGKDNLLDFQSFICAVDVKRARSGGLRPIPQKITNNQIQGNGDVANAETEYKAVAPKELNRNDVGVIDYEAGSLSRIQMWERKLLDFSLRNSLLNFRVTKNALPLLTHDLATLEDSLADGVSFAIRELPSEWTMSLRDARLYEIENENDLATNIASEEFKNKRICAVMHAEELEKTLKNIYRTTKASIEENGSNTLFLALGFLKWYESDLSEKPRYAPLIMIPVELVKSSHNKGYLLRSRQEETQINITLIEYLRQIFELKIPSLDPLPEDEHGTDIPLVFNTIRNCILDKKRWNVVDTACLGQFSFGQFVMWSDLRNRANELMQNKVVAGLVDKKIAVEQEEHPLTVNDLDNEIAPDDLAIPLSADSSQMLAIAEAAKGKSFVLHGPPGTGKSQTITNLIANALYHGKSVLFVAEKMAALNVVQNRLEKIGLAPFCLELHSNKASKSSVLSQLDKSLEVGRIKHPEKYKATADRLKTMRISMNAVIDGLHQKHESGISVYDAIEQYEGCAEFKGMIQIPQAVIDSINEDKIESFSSLITGYTNSVEAVGDVVNNPLKNILFTEYSIPLRESLYSTANDMLNLYNNAKASIDRVFSSLNLSTIYSKKTISDILNLCKALLIPSAFSSSLVLDNNYNMLTQRLLNYYQSRNNESAEKQEIEKVFTSGIYEYNSVLALNEWNTAQSSWILSRNSKQKKLLKEIAQYCIMPGAVTKENIVNWYQRLININKLHSENLSCENELSYFINELGSDYKQALNKSNAVYNALSIYNENDKRTIITAIKNVNLSQLANDINCVSDYIVKWTQLAQNFKINSSEQDNNWLNSTYEILDCVSKNIDKLYAVTEYNAKREQLKNENLECVCNAVESGKVDKKDAVYAFNCNVYYALALKYISADESLASFRSNSFEQTISEYHALIDEYSQLTIQELVATLSAQVPVSGTASASSELGILKRAIKSNGRMMSIRKLFNEIPALLRRLCPCMLMSPISVAQYIDPSFPKFDLVVFDEASQLPTSEAVGTIARGENVVVVGDPNQLPPTSFFKSNRIDEENIENEDLESLLDDCLSISMPQMYLKWHYRSRHESLIAYSNMKYYDNKLYTFPSPNDRVSAVKLIHIDGYYDKGGTKQNEAEAQAVVNEIIRRLSDEELRTKSIGVVTFNIIQQNLIEDMLADEFAKHPDLEKLDSESAEPVFVKNLENVQGDERDVILFSVGYGPDKDGKVSMNFGPLNRDGGWRRLNVAISRARQEMIVYSTLTPEQIDLSRTRALGVEGLKGFLKFAGQNRNIVIPDEQISKSVDNTVIEEIAKEIEKLGYKVNCNIGCSEYKIDIGVVDPENPDNYILGILADGENCKNSATSKDRFVLQPDVLAGLGWKIMRVWTLDWLDNSTRVIDKIKSEIEQAVANKNEKQKTTEVVKTKNIEFEKIDTSDDVSSQTRQRVYESFPMQILGDSNSFYSAAANVEIQKLMFKVISVQAPISKKALYKTVLSAYGISRSGTRAEALLDSVLGRIMHSETSDNGVIFIWKPEQKPDEYEIFRVADSNADKRNIDDIPSNEILNAVIQILCEQGSMLKSDLIKETAKKFGFTRTGSLIEITVGFAVENAINGGKLSVSQDGKINIP